MPGLARLPPRLEVVAAADAVEARLLGELRVLQQVARARTARVLPRRRCAFPLVTGGQALRKLEARPGASRRPLRDARGSRSTSAPRSSSARQRGERLEAEDALEERRRAIADRAELVLAPALGDQAALGEAGDDAVDVDAADARDLGPRHRAEVGDDRERLERGLRSPFSTGFSNRREHASAAARTRGTRSRRRPAPARSRLALRRSAPPGARAPPRPVPARPRRRRRGPRPAAAATRRRAEPRASAPA